MKDAAPQNPPTTNQRKSRIVRIVLWSLILVLVPVVILAGMFIKECLLVSMPPAKANLAAALLVKPPRPESWPASTPARTDDAATTTGATKTADAPTTATVATLLTYEPLIPDTPDIPPRMRAKRDDINRQFDQLLREIEAYEQARERMRGDELDRERQEISERFQALAQEVADTMDRTKARPERILEKYHAYHMWENEELIGSDVRKGLWPSAARRANQQLGWKMLQWREQRVDLRDVDLRTIITEYIRTQGGRDDFNRTIYYYRQQGGLDGYSMIAKMFIRLKEAQLHTYYMR